jgi:hypothetical protein
VQLICRYKSTSLHRDLQATLHPHLQPHHRPTMRFAAIFFAVAALVAVAAAGPLEERCATYDPCDCKGQAGCPCC